MLVNAAPLLLAAASSPVAPIIGFSYSSAEAERAREARLDTLVSPADQDAWMKRLTDRPHHVGSAAGHENALWMAEQLKSWGFTSLPQEYLAMK